MRQTLTPTRRHCLAGALLALSSGLRALQGFAADGTNVFAFSRSGRFTPYGWMPLLLGGIVVAKTLEREIEEALERSARDIPFRIALDYGTNKHHPIYLRRALDVLSSHPAFFIGASLNANTWPAEADTLAIWRKEAEALFIKETLRLPQIELVGVRHARGQDDVIYTELEQRLGLSPTRFYPSHDESPRLLQLASTVTKCFGSMQFGRSVKGAKATMIEDVIRHFGISRNPQSWHTPRLWVGYVNLNF